MIQRTVAGMFAAALTVCGAADAAADDASWTRSLSTAEVMGNAAAEGVRIEPTEPGADERAIVFDDAGRNGGKVVIDLSSVEGLDLSTYDELHFDLRLGHGIVEPAVTLLGYPDDRSTRRWFYKRFPRIGAWETVRLDLDLDDDGSLKRGKKDERSLTIGFSRPAAQPTLPEAPPTATIRHVRLVRRPVSVTLDPRRVSATRGGSGGWRFEHPVELENRTDAAVDVRLRVVDETLDAAGASLSAEAVSLGAGERREVVATLTLPDGAALEPGHVERARLEVDLPGRGLTLEPIRGYRPTFLFAAAPPKLEDPAVLADGEPPDADRLEELARATDRRLEVVTGVVPRYEDHFRCKACGHRLRARDLYHYACANKDCEKRGDVITVTREDPLFASYLSVYHKENAALAADLARAFAQTGEKRYAEAAKRWLLDYAEHLGSFPIVSEFSTGWHSRLSSATLFEKESLLPFTDAFLLLRARGVLDGAEAARVADGLLVPLLYDINLHHYGATAGQVNFILATLKAAAATGRWWFFADALAGDAGLAMLLDRGYDADGIGVEGGAYATSAAERMVHLGAFLDRLGVEADRERIAEIERNSRLIGLLPGGEWRPVVLEDTGFAVLVHGEGAAKRRATINWRRPRERGEHDLLSYDFADPSGPLIEETGRIAYGNKHSSLMLRSAAHNTPVIGGRDLPNDPMQLRWVGENEHGAWCVVGGRHGSMGDAEIERAIVLVRGCLIVVDRVRAGGAGRIELPIYGLSDGEAESVDPVPLGGEPPQGPFGDRWRRTAEPVDRAAIRWRAEGRDALRMHYTGDEAHLLAGETVRGWTAKPRDLFVLRREASGFDAVCVYESLRAGGPRVTDVERDTSARDRAAVTVTFDDGTRVRVATDADGPPSIRLIRDGGG